MVKSSKYKKATPERALANFLIAWKHQDWNRMKLFTQITWKATEVYPDFLSDTFDVKELRSAKIIRRNEKVETPVLVDIIVRVQYRMLGESCTKLLAARVIREREPFHPSESGTWGVNPISVIREYKV